MNNLCIEAPETSLGVNAGVQNAPQNNMPARSSAGMSSKASAYAEAVVEGNITKQRLAQVLNDYLMEMLYPKAAANPQLGMQEPPFDPMRS